MSTSSWGHAPAMAGSTMAKSRGTRASRVSLIALIEQAAIVGRRWARAAVYPPGEPGRSRKAAALPYLYVSLIMLVVTICSASVVQVFRGFSFPDVLYLLLVALVALRWGPGPSLFATVASVLMLEFVVVPPPFSGDDQTADSLLETGIFLAVGASISLVASSMVRARSRAQALANTLDAMLETVPDPLAICDASGTVVRVNAAARRIALPLPLRAGEARTPGGDPYPAEDLPIARALRGEAVSSRQVLVMSDDDERHLSVSAAPLRGHAGDLQGALISYQDVTALYRATHEAATAREAARLKSELLGTVGHELRTPLGAIKGFASSLLLYGTQLNDAESRESLRLIEEAADRLAGLIDDLLDMQRLDAGRLAMHWDSVDIAALARAVVVELRATAPRHTLTVEAPAGLPALPGDAHRLRQVLLNVIGNAIKYSPMGGAITVTVREHGEEVELRVRDEGIGIPPEQLERIFDRFHRVDSSRTRRIGGTGLGLAIVRSLVDAHGGRVWAESNGPGHGAVLVIRLPRDARDDERP